MAVLYKRQFGSGSGSNGDDDGGEYGQNGGEYNSEYNNGSWWWSPAGLATRYAIVALLFGLFILFFVGGYYHAQRRIRKGLPPLAYHRWMVRRQQNRYGGPPQPQTRYAHYRESNNQSYGMEQYPPPPPAYNNAEVPPPVYQPPEGASKVMADQNFAETNRAGEGSGSANIAAPATAARQ